MEQQSPFEALKQWEKVNFEEKTAELLAYGAKKRALRQRYMTNEQPKKGNTSFTFTMFTDNFDMIFS